MPTKVGKSTVRAIKSGVPARSGPVYTQTQLAAPAGGTGATAGAYDTAANRNLAIASINAARTDIAFILGVLRDTGLIR